MLITVLFIKVSVSLHKSIKSESAICDIPVYGLYNYAMEEFSAKMRKNYLLINFTHKTTCEYKDVRVEKVDSEIYKSFKITCIQKDISITQGINLALTSWLEVHGNDIGSLEIRT